jgi:hypothetical protein
VEENKKEGGKDDEEEEEEEEKAAGLEVELCVSRYCARGLLAPARSFSRSSPACLAGLSSCMATKYLAWRPGCFRGSTTWGKMLAGRWARGT